MSRKPDTAEQEDILPEWATPDPPKTQRTVCTGIDHQERLRDILGRSKSHFAAT